MSNESQDKRVLSQDKRVLCVGKVFDTFIAIRMAPAPRPAADKQADKPLQGKISEKAKEK